MPIGPLAILGISAGANILNRLLQPKAGTDPRQYQSMLRMGPGIEAQLRGGALRNVGALNMLNVQRIKQMGAAGRMPRAATQSALAGASYGAARGAAMVEPELARQRQNLDARYFGLMNQYDLANQGRFDFGQDIGELTRAMIMWKMGLFDSGGAGKAGNAGSPGRVGGIGPGKVVPYSDRPV